MLSEGAMLLTLAVFLLRPSPPDSFCSSMSPCVKAGDVTSRDALIQKLNFEGGGI